MSSIIDTFVIDWKIIIAQAVNFGVVFIVLYIYALKPLSKLMAERTEKIMKGIDDAKANARMLEASRAEYEKITSKARLEANDIFQEGKKEAEAKKALMLEDAKNQVQNMIENGKKSLQAEKAKMVEEAKKDIVSLVLKTTEKLIGEIPDGSFNKKALKDLNNL
jgi:F-type H+-transporting ATPase subunit b